MAKRKSTARGIQWISLLTGIALGVALTLGARQALDFFAEGLVSERADSITYENPEAQELSFRFFDMLTEGDVIDTSQEMTQAPVQVLPQTVQEEPVTRPDLEQAPAPAHSDAVEQPPIEASPQPLRDSQAGPRYLLQVGSFRDADKANALRRDILLLGLASRTVQVEDPEGGIFNRVIVGPYDTKEQAADAAKRLRAKDIDSLPLYRAT